MRHKHHEVYIKTLYLTNFIILLIMILFYLFLLLFIFYYLLRNKSKSLGV